MFLISICAPGRGVGCQCWNILREHNTADEWMDAQKSLETIADEEVTKKILIQYFQNLTLFFFFQ